METLKYLLLAVCSIFLLVVSYILLPRLELAEWQPVSQNLTNNSVDTLRLVKEDRFLPRHTYFIGFVDDPKFLEQNATIGLCIADKWSVQREVLEGLLGGIDTLPTNVFFPDSMNTDNLFRLKRVKVVRKRAREHVTEKELLLAQLAGAEDAIPELVQQIQIATGEQRENLRTRLAEQQHAIQVIKSKLNNSAEHKETFIYRDVKVLDEERVENWITKLTPDTTEIRLPRAGYYVPPDTSSYAGVLSEEPALVGSQSYDEYYLQLPVGSILLSRADRIDTLAHTAKADYTVRRLRVKD